MILKRFIFHVLIRFHKDVDTSNLPLVNMSAVQFNPDVNTNVYKCASCNYLFGNMSDLKRHLKTRHHVNVKDLSKVGDGQGGLQVLYGSNAILL